MPPGHALPPRAPARNEVVAFDLFPAKTAPTLIGRTRPILDGPTPTYATDPEHKKKADPNAEFGPKLAPPATPKTAPQAHKEQP
jgi:hypothetical protein